MSRCSRLALLEWPPCLPAGASRRRRQRLALPHLPTPRSRCARCFISAALLERFSFRATVSRPAKHTACNETCRNRKQKYPGHFHIPPERTTKTSFRRCGGTSPQQSPGSGLGLGRRRNFGRYSAQTARNAGNPILDGKIAFDCSLFHLPAGENKNPSDHRPFIANRNS